MRWLQVAFGISVVVTILLQARAQRQRRERHVWRGWEGDAPMDLTGAEQWDPANYTAAGRRAFRHFVAAVITTVCLGVALLYAALD